MEPNRTDRPAANRTPGNATAMSPPASSGIPVPGTLQQDPLAELRDIHLPGPVASWPPAPGWWGLGLVLALALGILGRWAWRRWQAGLYRREALRELRELLARARAEGNSRLYLIGCAALLKRVALVHSPRAEIAALTGEEWVAFLDRTGRTNDFTLGAGQALIQGPYREHAELDVDELHRVATRWIKKHRHGPRRKISPLPRVWQWARRAWHRGGRPWRQAERPWRQTDSPEGAT